VDQHVEDAAVHPEAAHLEHAHEVAERLAETLGDPQSDPHGQPIPPRS
jgi:Mn-dependent DtxR family transcriptional regulator